MNAAVLACGQVGLLFHNHGKNGNSKGANLPGQLVDSAPDNGKMKFISLDCKMYKIEKGY